MVNMQLEKTAYVSVSTHLADHLLPMNIGPNAWQDWIHGKCVIDCSDSL